MKITFLGAAGEVTGSQHLIETSNRRILLDCGFFQGPRAESRKKNEVFYCDPPNVDAVFLSHAHLDHCGNLPRLYKQGFRGPIFCTEATADIAEIMLLDSAKIQVEDAAFLSKNLTGKHPPIEPLYTEADVYAVMKLFEPIPFDVWHSLSDEDEIRVRFLAAGHILGSAITELELSDEGEMKRIVYTGDIGRRNMPLMVDPAVIKDGADVVICEATYGDRVHFSVEDMQKFLLNAIREAYTRGGRVIIPAFALGRTQQIAYYLNNLFNQGLLPRIPIFIDSPLATRLTKLFMRHHRELDADVQEVLSYDDDPFEFPTLTYIRNQRDSMALNKRDDGIVIISASGMCENGRIVHHLKHAVSDPKNVILLMGYQAPNTLGRQLAERQPVVRIFGHEYELKATVHQLDGLSAHADADDLKWWFDECAHFGSIGQAFLVHAEPDPARTLAKLIENDVDQTPIIPKFGETYEI